MSSGALVARMVRCRDALADTAREQSPYPLLCRATDAPAIERGTPRVRQAESVQHQRRGLIAGIVGAVAEKNTCAREASRAARDECAHGDGAAFALHRASGAPGAWRCVK